MKDFNFFSHYKQVEKRSNMRKISIFIISAIMILIFGGSYILLDSKINGLIKIVSIQNTFLESNDTIEQSKNYQDKKLKLESMQKHYDLINDITEHINRIDTVNPILIEKVASVISKEIFLKSIIYNASEVQIQGISMTRTGVAELEYNLRTTDLFNTIRVISINKEKETTNYNFDIKCGTKVGVKDEIYK